MLTKNVLVTYRREALTTKGIWITTIDGGRLLKCSYRRAIKWYDAYTKRYPDCRFSWPSFKQLTEPELKWAENRCRTGLITLVNKIANDPCYRG